MLTSITSVALCFLPYILGLNPTVIWVPTVPAGRSSPAWGSTRNSGSLPTRKCAVNGSGYLRKRTGGYSAFYSILVQFIYNLMFRPPCGMTQETWQPMECYRISIAFLLTEYSVVIFYIYLKIFIIFIHRDLHTGLPFQI